MSQTEYPPGWNEDRIKRVLAHYEKQTEDEALIEDEAGFAPSEAVVSVSRDLLPLVRELIAKHQQ